MNIAALSLRHRKFGASEKNTGSGEKTVYALGKHVCAFGAALLVALFFGCMSGWKTVYKSGYLDKEFEPAKAALAAGLSFALVLGGIYLVEKAGAFVRNRCTPKTLVRLELSGAVAATLVAALSAVTLTVRYGLENELGASFNALLLGTGGAIAVTPLLSLALLLRHGFSRKSLALAVKPLLLAIATMGVVLFLMGFIIVSAVPGKGYVIESY